ncbi:M48 family metallopeptidase [Pontibacillus sp. HMF3514]|uniref:tetratricopeptide repeat protein n=1 Tax=Pontibacillus sp. HMF3514 TaxID=2692425 RepID=UPI0013203F42|nr:hypothetical protein [Pontibacillus sp. HMF3514]QHE51745.1 hypothetical protein GS400_06705 [Pontibacillus sp. HMF3514]
MSQPKVTIKDHKQQYAVYVNRMTVYKQGKIVECTDDEAQHYYMFFYKQKYLNIVKEKPLKPDSYAKNALDHGTTFHAPHPLIDATISESEPYKKHLFNDLFPKLKQKYNYDEVTLIASFFESFIKKEQLIKFIKTMFYENRRNGKMFACYRIYRVLANFASSNSFVRSLASTLEFKKFDPLYEQLNTSLKEKDPIYYEQVLHDHLHDDEAFQKLSQFLQEEERWIDDLTISIQKFENDPTDNWYTFIQHKMMSHFQGKAFMQLLEDLFSRVPNNKILQKDLLNQYVQLDCPEKALNLIATQHLDLREDQLESFNKVLDHINLEEIDVKIEELNTVIASLFKKIPNQAASLLQKAIKMLMKDHSISFIQKWLEPLRGLPQADPIIEKVDQMQVLQDEPNKQLELGELYYEFSQMDEAIECFSWEMELHDQNPKPVQWLSKIYNELGQSQEAKAYQKLYVDMVKA